MMHRFFVSILIVSFVNNEGRSQSVKYFKNEWILGKCVTYTFENMDYYDMWDNMDLCADRDSWTVGNYQDIKLKTHHEKSTQFIQPIDTSKARQGSCVKTTRPVMLVGWARMTINVYVKSNDTADSLTVTAIDPNGHETKIVFNFANEPPKWYQLNESFPRSLDFEDVYIVLEGVRSPKSLILVESVIIHTGWAQNHGRCLRSAAHHPAKCAPAPKKIIPRGGVRRGGSGGVKPSFDPSRSRSKFCTKTNMIVVGLVLFVIVSFVSAFCYWMARKKGLASRSWVIRIKQSIGIH